MSDQQEKNVPEEISRCLRLFKGSKSDNERLASLMLIAKLSKPLQMNDLVRRRVYDAIGFDFINRLLATEKSSEEGGTEILCHVAIAILSCYCTDPQLVLHPQVTSKIPQLNQFISSPSSALVLVQDCLQCLSCLVESPKGLEYLWKYSSLSALFCCFTTHKDAQPFTRNVILHLLAQADTALNLHGDQLLASFSELTALFKETNEAIKFDVCQLLTDILSLRGNMVQPSDQWLSNVGTGLRDILQSKLDPSMRQKALILCGVLCQEYGAGWTLLVSVNTKNRSSFLLLLTHLASIEVQLLLKDYVSDPPVVIVSCFSIMESVILIMANQESGLNDKDKKIDEETLLHLHTTLMECLKFLVQSLKELEASKEHFGCQEHSQYLTAAVRLLGAWLAEDSLSLSNEVYSLLPFLLKLSCDNVENDMLKFLLPGFNHLVADEKPRRLLIECGLLPALLKHIQNHCSTRMGSSKDFSSQMLPCFSVLLTLLLSDQSIIDQEHIWAAWLQELSTVLTHPDSSILLLVHCSLLFILILKKHGGLTGFMDHIARILCVLYESLGLLEQDRKVEWDLLSELWHISMQELANFFSNCNELKATLAVSAQMNSFRSFVEKSSGNKVYPDEYGEIHTSIAALCQTITEST